MNPTDIILLLRECSLDELDTLSRIWLVKPQYFPVLPYVILEKQNRLEWE